MGYVLSPEEQWQILYSLEYLEYLKTPQWAELSRTRRGIDGDKCVMCGCRGSEGNILQAHHLNYKSLRHENVWTDLVTLCVPCHKMVHRMMKRQTSADGRHGWADEFYVPMYNSTNTDEVKTG